MVFNRWEIESANSILNIPIIIITHLYCINNITHPSKYVLLFGKQTNTNIWYITKILNILYYVLN